MHLLPVLGGPLLFLQIVGSGRGVMETQFENLFVFLGEGPSRVGEERRERWGGEEGREEGCDQRWAWGPHGLDAASLSRTVSATDESMIVITPYP